ncbi:MAG TPA: hypothetical protein VKR24_00745 [Candidatus Limnocylindrales bacterium]|nr:hypothetical protein [Candidatus Limnocylindrales bacterium]
MEPSLNVDRYLTERLRIVRRLVDAQLPPTTAERWVEAWEAEAQRRGLDPRIGAWWRSGWQWITQACSGPEPSGRARPELEPSTEPAPVGSPMDPSVGPPWTSGPFAEPPVGMHGETQPLAAWLREAMEQGGPVEDGLLLRVGDVMHRSSEVIAAFHAWLGARTRYREAHPKAPDYQWLRREMERLCAAYDAALGEVHRP